MFKNLTPNIVVKDVNATIDFYREVLGFAVVATVPETGKFGWANLKRDDVEMMFQSQESIIEDMNLFEGQNPGGTLTFYIGVNDIQSLYERVKNRAKIALDMRTTFYGAREFGIEDLNGYILVFSASSAEA